MALTNSRYDMVQASVTIDPKDKQGYPDILSVDFTNFYYTEPPYIVEPDTRLQEKPYIYASAYYGAAAYEDIILNINGVLHTSLLFDKTEIKFPTVADVNKFMVKTVQ